MGPDSRFSRLRYFINFKRFSKKVDSTYFQAVFRVTALDVIYFTEIRMEMLKKLLKKLISLYYIIFHRCVKA